MLNIAGHITGDRRKLLPALRKHLSGLSCWPTTEYEAYFIGFASNTSVRSILQRIDGIEIFDSVQSPKKLSDKHYDILKQHGAQPHHTTFEALEEVARTLGIEDTHLNPHHQ